MVCVCVCACASLPITCAALASSSGFTAGGLSYCREERRVALARGLVRVLDVQVFAEARCSRRLFRSCCVLKRCLARKSGRVGLQTRQTAAVRAYLSDRTGGWTQPHRCASHRPGQGQGPPSTTACDPGLGPPSSAFNSGPSEHSDSKKSTTRSRKYRSFRKVNAAVETVLVAPAYPPRACSSLGPLSKSDGIFHHLLTASIISHAKQISSSSIMESFITLLSVWLI